MDLYLLGIVIGISMVFPVSGALPIEGMTPHDTINSKDAFSADNTTTYVANNNSVQQLFYVLGGVLKKPVIVSPEAAKKRISGNFDLTNPRQLLNVLSSRIALIWYDDGSSIYVYDVNEMQSRVIKLAYASFNRLEAYLQSTGLYDDRFPPRSHNGSGSFYLSGPPVYVDLVAAAAKYIDSTYSQPSAGENVIRVIKLKNTFVNDRAFSLRDTPITIPGMATVLNQLLNNRRGYNSANVTLSSEPDVVENDMRYTQDGGYVRRMRNLFPLSGENYSPRPRQDEVYSGVENNTINIVAYTDTNSLLIQGSEKQVAFVDDLIRAIDIAKQQIQLSLWIIDISKNDVENLGVVWQGQASIGSVGINFNGATSALNPASSMNFLTKVTALVEKGNAQVVSRPVLLTQENVPALFDNNSSFYTRLLGERYSSLEKVTFGTMISVIPRLGKQGQEIEMVLNIQDGKIPQANGVMESVDALPVVNNTQISTTARVPMGYSLLIGGYSREQDELRGAGIPLLKDIPVVGKLFDYTYTSHRNMVRLFLIQPRLLAYGETWQGRWENNPVLGRNLTGEDTATLQSTVIMLRQFMNKRQGM
ncbi:type III secretion system outer membrane ring subunit SctC [Candidatus Symbiopectobacterium sp. NZEC135]|nr:type III secretion system outer membrane ring subunit SctC [Candidatus Symbiopectobacterium sp. NZEC135]